MSNTQQELREQIEEFALHLKPGTTKGKHRTAIFDTLELAKLVQSLIAKEVAEAERVARIDELNNLHKDLELVPFDPTGTLGFDEHMLGRSKEEVQWAKDKNRAHSIAAMELQGKIKDRIAHLQSHTVSDGREDE